MAHSFEMGPIESKTPEDMVHRAPSRAKSSLTDDRIAMSRMGATQELKVCTVQSCDSGKTATRPDPQNYHFPRRHG
jgi:hypothetical protein